MFQNEIFEQKWKIVEETFHKFLKSGVLPLTIVAGKDKKTVTEEHLGELIRAIHDEIFTISVCGQVKAGKSTLLNSLFFGDDVLPVFDTPMTAKLTFLEYRAGEPGFEVEFYSEDEWNELRSIMKIENGDALMQLDERCQYCAEKFGEWWQNWIGHPPVTCKKLEALAQYVSVPKDGGPGTNCCGRFTPFVKQVKIHLPHENLKNLRIVDTPGLNDSNIINSSQTTEWVKNAHAVIYVLDVTGAHEPDIIFFQKYFPSSASDARIFVQNKIDTNQNAASVRNAIRQYGKQSVYRELGLFGEDETICSYSGLLALRQSKIKAGKQPSEAEDYAYGFDWIDEDFDPDPDHLQEQISRKLYQRSGCIRISRIMGEFINLAQEKHRQLMAEKELKEEQAHACGMDQKKLDDRILKLKEFCAAIDDTTNATLEAGDRNIRHTIETLKHECAKSNAFILKKIERDMTGMEHLDDVLNKLPSRFIYHIRESYAGLSEKIIRTKKKLYEHLDEQKGELLDLASRYGFFEDLVSAKYIETDCGKEIDGNIEKLDDFSKNLEDQLPNGFTNLFTRMSTIRSRAYRCAAEALNELLKSFGTICDSLKDQTERQMRTYLENVATWANERRGNLEEVKRQSSQKQDMQKQYYDAAENFRKQAEVLVQKINELKDLKNSILPDGR